MRPPKPLPASSASSNQPSSEVVRQLEEDLQLERIYLDSLQGTPEDTPAKRAEFKEKIRDIKRKLGQYQRDKPPPSSSNLFSRPSANTMFGQNNRFQARPWDGSMSNMSRAGMNMSEPRQDTSSGRKRTFDAHIGSSAPPAPSKSRRTTPSPLLNPTSTVADDPFNDAQIIDLTEDDWKSQKERLSSLDEKRRREKEDAEAAWRLDAEINGSASPFSDRSGLTAFNPSHPGMPRSNRPINGSNNMLLSPSTSRAGSSSTLPSHLKSESHVSPFSSLAASNKPRPSLTLSSPSGARDRYPMPGSFDSDPEDTPGDDSLFSETESTYHSLPHDPSGRGSLAAEYSRQAALRRQQQHQQQEQHLNAGLNDGASPNFSQPASSSFNGHGFVVSGSRPGMLVNGTSDFWETPQREVPVYQGHRDSKKGLGAIIQETAGYDYENGTDRFGNPLPQHVRNVVNGIMENAGSSEEEIRQLLASIRPDEELTSEDRDNTPEQLRYPLYKHQQLALQWMQKMEQDSKKKGGILADDMGLGKTISSLALIVSRQAKPPSVSTQHGVKTNLIVGPVALVRQWHREIQTKIKPNHSLSVYMLHGKKSSFDHLRDYDIVLTTYGTISSEFKKMDKYIKDAKREGHNVDNADLNEKFPLLGPGSLFYRVFLDEAQYIKTITTLTARATSALRAEYRWCLTGTPLMNSPTELASLVHFLRIKPYCDFNRFKREFGVLAPKKSQRAPEAIKAEAMSRIQALLKAIMLRRSKNSLLDGKPIVNLPEKTEIVDHVIMEADELKFYQDLETNSRVQVSKYLKAGTVGKHYSVILVLLLRLRQACCHPYLHITDLEFINNAAPEDAMIEIAQSFAPEVVRRIKEAEGFDCPICLDAVGNPSIVFPCGHCICPECFASFQQGSMQRNIQAGQETADMQCPQCRGVMKPEKVISYEVFKKVYMPTQVTEELSVDSDETDSDTDDDSDSEFESLGDDVDDRGNLKGFVVEDDDEDVGSDKASGEDDLGLDDIDQDFQDNLQSSRLEKATPLPNDVDQGSDLEDISQVIERTSKAAEGKRKTEIKTKRAKRAKSTKRAKSEGKKKEEEIQPHMLQQLRKAGIKSSKAHKRYMRYLQKNWLPSAKVTKCCELLSKIQPTGEKTIIFSQWTILLDLLEIPIKHDLKLGYRRYEGGMSAIQRDNATRDFMEKPDVRVILVSLKAGNAGLNLTTASQVIIMDPFWNPYLEMQAVDRAHRIGQLRPVTVHRILIKETVEDKILALQAEKRSLVESALSEIAAASIGRLDTQQLAYLFGLGGR
ncbi:SNF2 family N-terminal domain-containing protein [Xylariaceae sp. FL0662B]|nr:SNF2 family N-terminal domain-containing protein [Xylariaceae sp. FL0662B]